MKYAPDRYLKFNAFAAQVVENVKTKLSRTTAAEKVGGVLYVIANILIVGGLYVFSALYMLLMAGAVAYYGSVAALFAAHPVIATLLLAAAGVLGMSVFRLTKTLYQQREVFDVVKKEVLDKFEPPFREFVTRNKPTESRIPEPHAKAVESLAGKAENSLIAGLLERTHLKPSDFVKSAVPSFIRTGFE